MTNKETRDILFLKFVNDAVFLMNIGLVILAIIMVVNLIVTVRSRD